MKRFSWLSKSKILSVFRLIPLLTVFQEIFLVYPWLVWFGTWVNWSDLPPHMNLISYIILTVFAEVFSHIAQERGWSAKRMQCVVLPAMIVLWLILFRLSMGGGYGLFDIGWFGYLNDGIFPAVIALLSGPYFIWRGISVSRQSNLFEDLYQKFIIGLGFIIALLIIWAVSIHNSSGIWSAAGIYGLSYFGVGLVILALANLDSLSRVFSRHQETVKSFRRRWSSMIIVMIVVLVGMSVALGTIFSTNLAATLASALSQLGEWIMIGFTWLFWPLSFIVAGLVYVFQWLISFLTHGKEPDLQSIDLDEIAREIQGKEQQVSHIPPVIMTTIKWTVVGIVIALVIYFIGHILRRYWQNKNEEGVEEETESLWSWATFRADLGNFFAWLFPWLRRRKKAGGDTAVSKPPDDAEFPEGRELNIREMYRAVLHRGRLLGLPRKKSETAYEYSLRLEKKKETVAEDLDQLTEAYVIERYGYTPAGPEKIAFFNKLWRSLNFKLRHSDSDTPH